MPSPVKAGPRAAPPAATTVSGSVPAAATPGVRAAATPGVRAAAPGVRAAAVVVVLAAIGPAAARQQAHLPFMPGLPNLPVEQLRQNHAAFAGAVKPTYFSNPLHSAFYEPEINAPSPFAALDELLHGQLAAPQLATPQLAAPGLVETGVLAPTYVSGLSHVELAGDPFRALPAALSDPLDAFPQPFSEWNVNHITGASVLDCPDGFALTERGTCVFLEFRPAEESCAYGSFRGASGGCLQIDSVPPDRTCPSGFEYFMKGCIRRTKIPPLLVCPPGYQQVEGQCYSASSIPPIVKCPPGTFRSGAICRKEVLRIPQYQCESGSLLAPGNSATTSSYPLNISKRFALSPEPPICIKVETEVPFHSCPASFTLAEGDGETVCVRSAEYYGEVTCPVGLNLQWPTPLNETDPFRGARCHSLFDFPSVSTPLSLLPLREWLDPTPAREPKVFTPVDASPAERRRAKRAIIRSLSEVPAPELEGPDVPKIRFQRRACETQPVSQLSWQSALQSPLGTWPSLNPVKPICKETQTLKPHLVCPVGSRVACSLPLRNQETREEDNSDAEESPEASGKPLKDTKLIKSRPGQSSAVKQKQSELKKASNAGVPKQGSLRNLLDSKSNANTAEANPWGRQGQQTQQMRWIRGDAVIGLNHTWYIDDMGLQDRGTERKTTDTSHIPTPFGQPTSPSDSTRPLSESISGNIAKGEDSEAIESCVRDFGGTPLCVLSVRKRAASPICEDLEASIALRPLETDVLLAHLADTPRNRNDDDAESQKRDLRSPRDPSGTPSDTNSTRVPPKTSSTPTSKPVANAQSDRNKRTPGASPSTPTKTSTTRPLAPTSKPVANSQSDKSKRSPGAFPRPSTSNPTRTDRPREKDSTESVTNGRKGVQAVAKGEAKNTENGSAVVTNAKKSAPQGSTLSSQGRPFDAKRTEATTKNPREAGQTAAEERHEEPAAPSEVSSSEQPESIPSASPTPRAFRRILLDDMNPIDDMKPSEIHLSEQTYKVAMCVSSEAATAILECPFGVGSVANGRCEVLLAQPLSATCPEGFTRGSQEKFKGSSRGPFQGLMNKKGALPVLSDQDFEVCELLEYADYQVTCPVGYERERARNNVFACLAEKRVAPTVLCPPGFISTSPSSVEANHMAPGSLATPVSDKVLVADSLSALHNPKACVKTTEVAPTVISNPTEPASARGPREGTGATACVLTKSGHLSCGAERKYHGIVDFEKQKQFGTLYKAKADKKVREHTLKYTS